MKNHFGLLVIHMVMNAMADVIKERVGRVEYYWTSTNDIRRSELPWMDRLNFNYWVVIRYGRVDSLTKGKIWKDYMKDVSTSRREESNEEEREYTANWNGDRDQKIRDLMEDKLDDNWYKGTEFDDDDLKGIVDYLDLQGYDRFVDIDDEAYEQRRCKLL